MTPITVYVIGYKGDRWLPACIETLRMASNSRMDLVLIDNVGNTLIDQLPLEAFETRVVKTPRPMGFADAHNFGITAAPPRGDFIILLNQDTKSQSGWIDSCVECMQRHPRLGILSPGLRTYEDNGWDPNFLYCARQAGASEQTLSNWSGLQVAEHVTGAAMVVRRGLLLEVGLFDPIFGSYYEDYDFCQRARHAKWAVGYLQSARVQHFSGSATTTLAEHRNRQTQIVRNLVISRLRRSKHRIRTLLRHLLFDLPRNLVRGLLRTPSSQPVTCTLSAHAQLLKLGPRLLIARRDHAIWRAHLDSIGWEEALGFGRDSGDKPLAS